MITAEEARKISDSIDKEELKRQKEEKKLKQLEEWFQLHSENFFECIENSMNEGNYTINIHLELESGERHSLGSESLIDQECVEYVAYKLEGIGYNTKVRRHYRRSWVAVSWLNEVIENEEEMDSELRAKETIDEEKSKNENKVSFISKFLSKFR